MALELNNCHISILNYGDVVQYCFYDDYYVLSDDEIIGYLYPDWKKHFVTFTIFYN